MSLRWIWGATIIRWIPFVPGIRAIATAHMDWTVCDPPTITGPHVSKVSMVETVKSLMVHDWFYMILPHHDHITISGDKKGDFRWCFARYRPESVDPETYGFGGLFDPLDFRVNSWHGPGSFENKNNFGSKETEGKMAMVWHWAENMFSLLRMAPSKLVAWVAT